MKHWTVMSWIHLKGIQTQDLTIRWGGTNHSSTQTLHQKPEKESTITQAYLIAEKQLDTLVPETLMIVSVLIM